MSPDQFQELLDRHGPDITGWPRADRQAAEALLAASSEAQARHRAALRLENDLASLPMILASDRLRRAVLDIPLDHPLPARPASPGLRLADAVRGAWRQWTAGLATATAALLLGVVMGANGLSPLPVDDDAKLAAAEPASDESSYLAGLVVGDITAETGP
ncbi:MAG TPA: hypothetical protein VED40_14365 [Azospirillaceae bacterium]|nr:hypothetical protein [Azospirillaceae bacterium]